MRGSMLRQSLLSNNLANAETPGYKPEDVDFQAALADAIQNGQPVDQVAFKPFVDAQALSADGNGVSPVQLSAAMGVGNANEAHPPGVQVAGIVQDQTAGKLVYDPSNPDANAQGYVQMPNVDTVTEMTDLIDSSRAYEANVTAMQASKQMFSKTLDLLR